MKRQSLKVNARRSLTLLVGFIGSWSCTRCGYRSYQALISTRLDVDRTQTGDLRLVPELITL